MRAINDDSASKLAEDCGSCGAMAGGGGFGFQRERRGTSAVPWAVASIFERVALCHICVNRVTASLGAATNGRLVRPGSESGRRIPPRRHTCDLCAESLNQDAIVVEVMGRPTAARTERRSSLQTRQQRVCEPCFAWIKEDFLADVSGESPPAMYIPVIPAGPVPSQVFRCGLDASDSAALGIAAGEVQRHCLPLTIETLPEFLRDATAVLFAEVDKCPKLFASTPPACHGRIIVVSTLPSMAKACDALRAGSTAFVASPFSEGQAGGAWRQALSGQQPSRDAATGLVILRGGDDEAADPEEHIISLPGFRGSGAPTGAWMLRRMLRGTDRIGLDDEGNPAGLVHCPASALDILLQRLAESGLGGVQHRPLRTARAA